MKRPGQSGFTLIELLVTISIMFIFFVMAVPSFSGLRQRAAIRGAADQTLSFWNEARFEAVKRNQLVKVGVVTGPDGAFCLGAATTTDEADGVPCDCLSEAPASNACDVGRWPSAQSEWRGVRLAGVSIAGSSGSNLHPVVIEPKRSTLTSAAARGTIGLAAAPETTMPGTIETIISTSPKPRCLRAPAVMCSPQSAQRRWW